MDAATLRPMGVSLRAFFLLMILSVWGLGFSVVPLRAQSTTDGAIGGTVYDASGGVVPNASILVHNNSTNADQMAISDDSGYYRVTKLQPATYTVNATIGGFAPFKAEDVIVQVGAITDLSPHLAVGNGTEQTVVVTGAAPEINTTSPDFASV